MIEAQRWCVVTHKALEVDTAFRFLRMYARAPHGGQGRRRTLHNGCNRRASAADGLMQLGPSFAISIVTRDMRNETR